MTRTAFVTGATAGIGEATVRTLVASGWRCIATGRRAERLDALVADTGNWAMAWLAIAVVMTPLATHQIADDIASRLARGQVYQPQAWETVSRNVFGGFGRHLQVLDALAEAHAGKVIDIYEYLQPDLIDKTTDSIWEFIEAVKQLKK